jgi:hypothetical protein
MEAKVPKHIRVYALAIDGAYAYEGEIINEAGQCERRFEGAAKLPRSGKTHQRDTITAIRAALEHCAKFDSAGTSRIAILTNLEGHAKAWRYGADFWTVRGKFLKQDGTPLANADLWACVLEHNKRTPLDIKFVRNSDLQMRILKDKAAELRDREEQCEAA